MVEDYVHISSLSGGRGHQESLGISNHNVEYTLCSHPEVFAGALALEERRMAGDLVAAAPLGLAAFAFCFAVVLDTQGQLTRRSRSSLSLLSHSTYLPRRGRCYAQADISLLALFFFFGKQGLLCVSVSSMHVL